ncbi:MAG: hypothetical protein DSY90_10020 [Deltaproteobacteria bacterium]|nr:MAG: hypothetical protein DSY90_10020 [Deltaproteobacteria bacterium]
MQSYPNFANHNERVIFTYTFSQPVIIRDFSILDIDGRAGSWGDAVIVTARSETGATLDPDNVVVGSFINQINPHQYEATNHQTNSTDSRSTLTFSFSDEPITELTITHYPAAIAASNPGRSAVIMTDFDFFYVYDYGDAGGYGTARHIRHFNEPWLGALRGDADLTAPQTNGDADADDTDGNDDEDGVTFRSPHGGDHAEIYADMQVVNDTGGDVYACAWLDRWDGTGNGGGSFDAGDVADSPAQACQTVADNGGVATTTTFYWNGLPSVSGHTFSRFRVCATLAECQNPTGDANGGEVEDHRIDFDFTPTAVTIGKVELKATRIQSFLDGLNVDQMDRAALVALLQAWDPADAAALSGDATREEILAALRNYLDPDGNGQVAVLAWDTLEERGTIGFYVKRSAGNNDWVLINNDMLPGLINAPMGGEYLLADPGARSGIPYQYILIEQEAAGKTRQYGPYTLEVK